MTEPRPLLRVPDVARLTGYSEDEILRDVHAGLLVVMRRPKGRAFLIHPDAYEEYLKAIAYTPTGPTGPRRLDSDKKRRLRAIASGRTR